MIVELFGLPGSGKTTLAKTMEAHEGYVVVKIASKRELLEYNALYFFKHPVKFFITLWYVVFHSHSFAMLYYKFMNFFLDTNARYQKALRYPKAVLDQGYFQNILSVFEHEIGVAALRRYCRFLLKPDRLVVLDEPPAERERRNAARERFGPEYLEQWKKAVRKNFELAKRELS